MQMTDTVRKILANYEGEAPGVKAQLARMRVVALFDGIAGFTHFFQNFVHLNGGGLGDRVQFGAFHREVIGLQGYGKGALQNAVTHWVVLHVCK